MSTPKHFSSTGKQSRKLIWTLFPWVEGIKHSPDHPKSESILPALSAECSFFGLNVWLHRLQQPKAPKMLPWAFRRWCAWEHCDLRFALFNRKREQHILEAPWAGALWLLQMTSSHCQTQEPSKNQRKVTLGVIRSIKSKSEWQRTNNLIQKASIKDNKTHHHPLEIGRRTQASLRVKHS